MVLCLSVCLSVCLCQSQVGVLSKRLCESSWYLAWEFLSTSLTDTALKGNSDISKNNGSSVPSGTLFQTPNLDNFASANRLSRPVIDLVDEGGRPELHKLDRRR